MRARSGHAPLSYCPEEEDDMGALAGWAGQGGGNWAGWWAARVAPGKSFSLFLFLFCFILFLFYLNYFATVLNFKIIQTMPKTPLNILYC